MKHFQKIRTLDGESKIENRVLTKYGKSTVRTIEEGDGLVVTEKIDGSNAQVRNHHGELTIYSHKRKVDEKHTLNGFYEFVMERKEQLLKLIPDGCSFFGEWLTPHRIKYPTEAYRKWYLFDIFRFDREKEAEDNDTLTDKGRYLGIQAVHDLFYYLNTFDTDADAETNANKFTKSLSWYTGKDLEDAGIVLSQPIVPDVCMVPVYYKLERYYADNGVPKSLEDLDTLREHLSKQSILGADNGQEEGIVVTDIVKSVPIDETCTGPLRVKCVNEAFKEARNAKNPLGAGQKAALEWASKYITEPRIKKHILEMQDEDQLPKELSFDLMRDGSTKKISDVIYKDALAESVDDLPMALTEASSSYKKNLKIAHKFCNKMVNKIVALTIKGMI